MVAALGRMGVGLSTGVGGGRGMFEVVGRGWGRDAGESEPAFGGDDVVAVLGRMLEVC